MKSAFEIEHKYLIRMPDVGMLAAQAGYVRWEIVQTYLLSEPGVTERVRLIRQDGEISWWHTTKRRISVLASDEAEAPITQLVYDELLLRADPERQPIRKTRYRIPWQGQLLEIDLYPFWTDRAILEIEVEYEAQNVMIPSWLEVIREVTGDIRYKNARLAREIPMDPIE